MRFLDFCALTNHVEGAKRLPVDDFWELDIAKAEEYNSPGSFVTFVGFEWGGWTVWGDKCVYYLGNEGPYFPANEPEADTPKRTRRWPTAGRSRAGSWRYAGKDRGGRGRYYYLRVIQADGHMAWSSPIWTE